MSNDDHTFDPDVFMSAEVSAPMETTYTPVAEGEYLAAIDDIKVRKAKDSVICDVTWLIMDDALKASMGMDRITVRQSVFLDVEASGALQLGPNKNVQLGKLRAALGQNGSGPWSFAQLKGAGPVKITVGVRPDRDDPEKKYNDVKKIAA
jgi:hypothetical protein